jgi:hypothetical protein
MFVNYGGHVIGYHPEPVVLIFLLVFIERMWQAWGRYGMYLCVLP